MATSTATPAAVREATVPRFWRAVASGAPLAGAVLVWGLSLASIDLYGLDDYGLLTGLPVGWYAALAVCALGAAWNACAGSTRWGWAYLLGVVVVLFVTVPLVSEAPHYSWTYKHLGVVQYIVENGGVDGSIDIYHHWPGFFALAAMFGRLAGLPDPVAFAAWSEVFFTTLNLLVFASIVRAVTGSRRVPVVAGLFFLTFNWVGQTYFSPQALTYLLHFVLLWLVVTQLGRDVPNRLGALVLRVGALIVRRVQEPALPTGHRWMSERAAIAAVLLIDAAIVASHQLSPYLLLLQVAGLTLLGLIGPRLMVIALFLIAAAYLAPNFHYVTDHFTVFERVDPISNAQQTTRYENSVPMAGKELSMLTARALTALMVGGAAIAAFVLARRGQGARALLLLVLAVAPFGVVVGLNYGGEAPLRTVLFSSPWCATLIAWALVEVARTRLRVAATGAVAIVASIMFVAAAYGQEELHAITRDEVRASQYLYANGAERSAILPFDRGFPQNLAANYPDLRAAPSLLSHGTMRGRPLGAADLELVMALVRRYAPRGYIVFSATTHTHAEVLRLAPPGASESLEAAIAASPRFHLFYRGANTRIYELPAFGELSAGLDRAARGPGLTDGLTPQEDLERMEAEREVARDRAAAKARARRRAAAAAQRRARERRPPAAVAPAPVAPPVVPPPPPPVVRPQPPPPPRPPAPPPPPPPAVQFDDSG